MMGLALAKRSKAGRAFPEDYEERVGASARRRRRRDPRQCDEWRTPRLLLWGVGRPLLA